MELTLCRKPYDLDPKLEALRAKGLQHNGLENKDWILRLMKRAVRIHAGFLFEDRKTLQDICLLVSETQNKVTDSGWEAFGYHLGLSLSVLKVINYNNFNKEDPCYNVLLAYVQYENASIGKIIEALFAMGRIDILSRIKDSISDLVGMILQCQIDSTSSQNSLDETSDYDSLSTLEGCSHNSTCNLSSCEPLIKPKVIPPAPLIFQNIQPNHQLTSQRIQKALDAAPLSETISRHDNERSNRNYVVDKISWDDFGEDSRPPIRESIQNSSVAIRKEMFNSSKKKKYGIKIFLTFAEDGENLAEKICKLFRKNRDNYPSIGVLMLSEHIEEVNKDPMQFITGAFYQVDYVCPIITTGYCNLITKKQQVKSLSNVHIDASYVPYIFRVINSYFISNNCLNDKVRCIIPDSSFSVIPINLLVMNPVLGVWVKLSEVEEMAEKLLKSVMKK